MDNQSDWEIILSQLAQIREQDSYSSANIGFLMEQFQSDDERIRAAAALSAEGCIFEPGVLSGISGLAQYDESDAVRYAAIRTLGLVIEEGIEQGFEHDEGATTYLDDAEEWEEYQTGSLTDEYQGVKNALMNILEYDDDPVLQEPALDALSPLGHRESLRFKISEFLESPVLGLQRAAARAMGRYPQYWTEELHSLLKIDTPAPLLLDAVRSSKNAFSSEIANALVPLLHHDDSQILFHTIEALAAINKTKDLPEMLQAFSLHEDPEVAEAARDAIEMVSRKNFEQFMRDNLGMELD